MDEKVKNEASDAFIEMPIGAFKEEKGCLTVNGKIVAAYSANVREAIDDLLAGERKPPVLHLSGCSRFTVTPNTENLRLAVVDHAAETFPIYGLSATGRQITTRKPLVFCKTCLNRLRKWSRTPELVDRLAVTNDLDLFFELAPTLQDNAHDTFDRKLNSKPDFVYPSWAKPYVEKKSDSKDKRVPHLPDAYGRVSIRDFDIESQFPLIAYCGQTAGAFQPSVGKEFQGILEGRLAKPKIHIAACITMHGSSMSPNRLRPAVEPVDELPIIGPRHTKTASVAMPFCKNCLSMLRKATNHSPLIEELEKNPSMTLFYKLLPSIREQIEAKKARDDAIKRYWMSKKNCSSPVETQPMPSGTELPPAETIRLTPRHHRVKTPNPDFYDNASPVPNGEGLTFPGGLIAYRGEGAVLFRDRARLQYDDITDGFRSPGIFHCVTCGAIRKLRENQSLFSKYLVSTDRSTTFTVYGHSKRYMQDLTSQHKYRPCINCLKSVNWLNSIGRGKDLAHSPDVLENFEAEAFFRQYHSVFSDRSPLTKEEIAADFKNRRPGLHRRARAAKVSEGWRCRHCGVNLSSHQWLLRTLEKQGDTMPLCIACYRKAAGRPPLGVGYQDFRRLDVLRHRQNLMPVYDWVDALRAADPALRDAMKLALAAGYAPPEINTPIDASDKTQPVPDLIWRNERVAVSLRAAAHKRYRDWLILSPAGLVTLLSRQPKFAAPRVPTETEANDEDDLEN